MFTESITQQVLIGESLQVHFAIVAQYRYPEHIAYCERDVTTQTKNDVFATYRNELGFKLDVRNRANYKIDHFIPLCAGGSNHEDNLWRNVTWQIPDDLIL